jgi:predicted Zn-dependent protease
MNRHPEDPRYVRRLALAEAAAGRKDKARAAVREYLIFSLTPEERLEAEALEKSLGDKR